MTDCTPHERDHVTITFTSGESWLLEVPRPNKKQAQQVVSVLKGEGLGV